MYISKNIKYLRGLKEMSQQQVGDVLGKKKVAISQYEAGKSIPPGDAQIQLAQLFEVSIDDLVFRDIEKEGTSGAPVKPTPENEVLTALLARIEELTVQLARIEGLTTLLTHMEKHAAMLEQKIRDKDPELAKELGLD